jgi:hypothetical protein
MKRIPLAQGLWLGNALAFLIVIVALYFQLGSLVMPMKGTLELPPIHLEPLRIPERADFSGLINPFDPGAGHWKLAENRTDVGKLHGVLLLPGARAALTGSGIVYPGGQVNEGRLAQITQDGLIIQQENQTREIKLHAVPRPTLQTLNKAQPSANKEKK